MSTNEFASTIATQRAAIAGIKADLDRFADHPLIVGDIDTAVAVLSALPAEALKEQMKHQITLARYWHRAATELAVGADRALEHSASAYEVAAGAHQLVAGAHSMTASALSIAGGKAL